MMHRKGLKAFVPGVVLAGAVGAMSLSSGGCSAVSNAVQASQGCSGFTQATQASSPQAAASAIASLNLDATTTAFVSSAAAFVQIADNMQTAVYNACHDINVQLAAGGGGGGEGVVALEAIHWPDCHAEGAGGLLGEVELGEQLRVDTSLGLVASEEVVAERADGMVERHREMGDGFLGVVQQRQQRLDDANCRLRVSSRGRVVAGTLRVVSPIELVRPIDEMQPHVAISVAQASACNPSDCE